MALYVQKFGGPSVGTPERIEAVAEQVIQTVHAGHKVVVVVSAMAGNYAIPAHSAGRCQAIATPADTATMFTAVPLSPGTGTVTCSLLAGGSCNL